MKEEALALETVVVTAMGIKKKEASLTYSTQQVGGDELTRAKDPNMINALAGKTAGVSITRNSPVWAAQPKYPSAVSVLPMPMETTNRYMLSTVCLC